MTNDDTGSPQRPRSPANMASCCRAALAFGFSTILFTSSIHAWSAAADEGVGFGTYTCAIVLGFILWGACVLSVASGITNYSGDCRRRTQQNGRSVVVPIGLFVGTFAVVVLGESALHFGEAKAKCSGKASSDLSPVVGTCAGHISAGFVYLIAAVFGVTAGWVGIAKRWNESKSYGAGAVTLGVFLVSQSIYLFGAAGESGGGFPVVYSIVSGTVMLVGAVVIIFLGNKATKMQMSSVGYGAMYLGTAVWLLAGAPIQSLSLPAAIEFPSAFRLFLAAAQSSSSGTKMYIVEGVFVLASAFFMASAGAHANKEYLGLSSPNGTRTSHAYTVLAFGLWLHAAFFRFVELAIDVPTGEGGQLATYVLICILLCTGAAVCYTGAKMKHGGELEQYGGACYATVAVSVALYLLSSTVYDGYDASTSNGCGRSLSDSLSEDACYVRVFSSVVSLCGAVAVFVFTGIGFSRHKKAFSSGLSSRMDIEMAEEVAVRTRLNSDDNADDEVVSSSQIAVV